MLKRILSIVLVLAMLITIIPFNSAIANASVAVRSVSLNNGQNIYLEVGDEKILNVTVSPKDATYSNITYSSSDKSIVTVNSSGKIKALKTGNARITAEVDGKKASIRVFVYVNNNLKASFTTNDLVKDKIRNITINVSSKDERQTEFYIFLPTGYLVTGASATFAADKNGIYPFTVYDNTGTKKTFFYEINNLTQAAFYEVPENAEQSDFDLDILYNGLNLQYDYEKKQCLFNAPLDKIRTVLLPGNTADIETNEINYYIEQLNNGEIKKYIFKVEDKSLECRLIRQGEFYLLLIWQESPIDNRNVLVTYRAYNFTKSEKLKVEPDMDLIFNNGNYEILAYSDSGMKEIFSYKVSDIDFMRPQVNAIINYNKVFELEVTDNTRLDYIITYDGKYIKVPTTYESNKPFIYQDTQEFTYKGDYLFVCVDTSGNRTIESIDITTERNVPYVKRLGPEVHNSPYVKNLFSNIGDEYYNEEKSIAYYENTFPAYMKGLNNLIFDPDGTITRAEMITILCRITDLPYDVNLLSKTKLTDISNHWAVNYICMGVNKKYIKGYKDKTFKPNDKLSRADFCEMICNITALKTKISNIPAVNNYTFTDVGSQYSYALPEILKLANRGIVNINGAKFNPGASITRSEVICAINKLYNLSPSYEELQYIKNLYNKNYSFTDIKGSQYYDDIMISVIGMYREEK